MTVNLTSNTLPMSEIDDYAETMIAPRISMVNGVSQVQVQGASKYAVRVQLDPEKLHAQRIGLNEVDQALQNWNVNLPTGQLFGPTSTYNIKAAGQLMTAGAFRPIVVTYGAARRSASSRSPTSSTASKTCSTARGSTRSPTASRCSSAPSRCR
jgi:HAE1 family hydrophobic/amphiphilic exporter-1